MALLITSTMSDMCGIACSRDSAHQKRGLRCSLRLEVLSELRLGESRRLTRGLKRCRRRSVAEALPSYGGIGAELIRSAALNVWEEIRMAVRLAPDHAPCYVARVHASVNAWPEHGLSLAAGRT